MVELNSGTITVGEHECLTEFVGAGGVVIDGCSRQPGGGHDETRAPCGGVRGAGGVPVAINTIPAHGTVNLDPEGHESPCEVAHQTHPC